jgi:DNA-binding CsgD family transcriptional regulator
VPAAQRLGHRDYDAALALVSEAASNQGQQPFEVPTIEALLDLIPADRIGYYEYRNGGLACGQAQTFFVDAPALQLCDGWWSTDVVAENICWWPLRDDCGSDSGAQGSPLKFSDFLTRRARRRNPWYWEVMRCSDVEHEMKVWLPSEPAVSRGFFLVRGPGDPDFGERDRSILELLRPHLWRIRERWEQLRRRPAILTPREAEVLEHVADGLTNAEIAARLVVSPGTIRTHLENVFEKLEVHTRTAAVARLRGYAARS